MKYETQISSTSNFMLELQISNHPFSSIFLHYFEGRILYKPIIKLVNDGMYCEVDISLCSGYWAIIKASTQFLSLSNTYASSL